jgi:fascin 1/2
MAGETLSWSFGLRNHAGKYLTAETFGCRINANASSLKKKQIFFLEQEEGDSKVYIRSHLGKYLSATAAGDFTGDADGKGPNEAFEIEAQANGQWALRTAHGYYAGGTGEALRAYTKTIEADRLWTVQLAMHPQVNVKNVNRKRYVHLSGDSLTTDEDIPWGDDALITLVFNDDGRYSLQACDGRYLSSSGALTASIGDENKFVLEFYGSKIALRSSAGKYLTALGATGVLRATKDSVGKDELFVLTDSEPQIKLTAWNEKKASIKSGVAVNANQVVTTDTESFQLELHKITKKWSFRCASDKFWTVADDGSIAATSEIRREAEWFDIEWHGAQVAIRAFNGKYVITKKNGAFHASGSEIDETALYVWELINRPRLVLRGEYGFVGMLPSGSLECNKSTPEVFLLDVKKGVCHIQGSNGKYWTIGDNGNLAVTSSEPVPFFLEFVEYTKFLIKVGDKYVKGSQNGAFTATGDKAEAATLWEY